MAKEIREPIVLDVNHMMSDIVGYPYGIDTEQVDRMTKAANAAQANVQKNRGTGWLGWMDLPYNQRYILDKIENTAESIRKNFENFVVLGIGGSALGPIAVQYALNHQRYNELPKKKRNGPRFYVEDNIDPERMQSLLDVIDIKRTCFNVITKSGGTAETMSQYLIISNLLKKEVGEGWQKHIIATTSDENAEAMNRYLLIREVLKQEVGEGWQEFIVPPTEYDGGNLIKLARKEGFETFFIPDGVGGRFSELCPVGLLSAAVCGIDIRALLEGAAAMDARCQTADVWQNPALLEAVLQFIAMQEMDMNIHVVMPYADSLRFVGDWFCQLWAESLGKNVTRKGMAVNVGQTPTKALGVTDQHSQLQLYTEGPFDKVITFLKVNEFRHEVDIPHGCEAFADVAFLGGKTLNQLIEAERQGTEYALYRAGRMSQTITLPEVNAYTLGQLLYFFQMVTAYVGELLDIDAFNQPGVEESKIASYAVLGNQREKYLKKAEEMKGRGESRGQYVLT